MASLRCSDAPTARNARCRCRQQELLEAQVLVYLRGLGVDAARP